MKLIRRLALAILSWMQCLQGVTSEPLVDTTTDASAQVNLGGTPELEVREPTQLEKEGTSSDLNTPSNSPGRS